MKIYLDVLMLSNALITLVFVRLLSLITHTALRRRGLLLSMLAGAAGSLIILIRPDGFAESLLLTAGKLAISALTVAIAFSLRKIGRVIRFTAAYIAVNIAFGGICMLLWELTGAGFVRAHNLTVYFNVPLWLLMLCVAAAYLLISVYERLCFRAEVKAKRYRAVYTLGDYSIDLPAVSDTGNKLRDCFSGEPVVIFASDRLCEHFGIDDTSALTVQGFRLIPYSTVAGGGLLPVTLRGTVTVSDGEQLRKELRCAVGITRSRGRERAVFDPALLI